MWFMKAEIYLVRGGSAGCYHSLPFYVEVGGLMSIPHEDKQHVSYNLIVLF